MVGVAYEWCGEQSLCKLEWPVFKWVGLMTELMHISTYT